MFKFLKEKLKSFFKKSSKELAEETTVVVEEAIVKIEKTNKEGKKSEIKKEKAITKTEGGRKGEEKINEKEEFPEERARGGFFARLKKRHAYKITEETFQAFWAELETVLLESNVALGVVDKIKQELQTSLVNKEVKRENVGDSVRDELKRAIYSLMIEPFDLIDKIKNESGPYVIVFFGINGSGKTTTIAKLVYLLQQKNLKCILAASDTFRAASIEQLEKHASKLGVKLIKQGYGADAAAVAFDAVSYAKAHDIDVVLVDTAGRMHTQTNLMREMEKICRVTKPNLKIFVGEATVGNDMMEQAKSFSENVGIDAMILSKADVDEKGGTAISASYVTKKPILFLGTGQEYRNLERFDSKKLLEGIGL